MITFNFKNILIGLTSLLVVSVAQGKCYPGLDCPEDLPNANNTPTPPNNQKIPEPELKVTKSKVEAHSPPDQEQTATANDEKVVGHKKTPAFDEESENTVSAKYGNVSKYGTTSKYKPSKYGNLK